MKNEIDDLKLTILNLRKIILEFPAESCLVSMGDWTPRDILAHMIGWNRYTITACRQIRMGDLPSKLVDTGLDYTIVDADSVKLYNSSDCELLLDEIETSYQSLVNFLIFMNPKDWDKDFGIRTEENTITIESVVRALLKNYEYHLNQLYAWANN